MSADDVTERAAAVIEPYLPAMPDQLSAGIAHDAAVALRDAGLFATDEHDRAVAARALRDAAVEIDRDLRIHAGSVGESPARTAEQEGRDHGVSIAMKSDARWLNYRANRIEAGEQP